MPGFDWNGNGKSDAFDHFMDMSVMSETSDESDNGFLASDGTENTGGEDVATGRAELIETLSSVSAHKNSTASKTSTSFQDELKQNLRSPEVVRQENAERANNAMRYEAERTLREIKNALLNKAKNAEYVTENGVTSLTCFCQMPYRFMRSRREDNGEQLRKNQQTFVLLRDPNLVYMTWNNYEIEPKYSNEYWQYISALRELAARENISIESVVYSGREKKYVPFPSKVRNDYSIGWSLCVKATTVIAGKAEDARPKTPNTSPCTPVSTSTQNNRQPDTERKEPESNGTTIAKSLLCVGLCVLGFVIMANAGGLIGALALIGAAILGYKIMSS